MTGARGSGKFGARSCALTYKVNVEKDIRKIIYWRMNCTRLCLREVRKSHHLAILISLISSLGVADTLVARN